MMNRPTKPEPSAATKLIALCVACLLPLGLVACGQDQAPATPTQTLTDLPSPDQTDLPWEEDMGNEQPFPTDWVFPDSTQTHNPVLVAAFTPEGAVVHADVESMLTLSTDLSLDEMIAFCLAAVAEVGATKVSIDHAVPGFWTYSGVLEGNLPLTVELRDDGDTTALILTY